MTRRTLVRQGILRRLKIVAGGILLVLVVLYSAHLAFYALTLLAYERLVAAKPATREEVKTLLSGFRETLITQREEMEPLFRDKLSKEMEYRRYSRYPGFPIDVVYNQAGHVDRVWPKFE
jgi:hypothetical protein